MAQSLRNRWCSRQGRRVPARRCNDSATWRGAGSRAASRWRTRAGAIRFLAGRDTRESGAWIERELAFGIQSQGGSYTSTGVVPTPAIAYLTPRLGYSAGVVISASHNPFEDNGIKVFSGAGEKFTETLERHVESIIADTSWSVPGDAARPVEEVDLRSEYLDHLRDILPDDASHARDAHRHRLRQRRDGDGGAAPVSRDGLRGELHRRRAGRSQHQSRLADRRRPTRWRAWSSRASTRWASRSMATAIARSSSTERVRSSMATP